MKIRYILLIFLMVLTSSCSFLDEYSQDELKPSTTEDYDKILIGGGYANKLPNFMPYYDLLTDDVGTWEPCLVNGELDMNDINQRVNIMPFYEWDRNMFEITLSDNKNTKCNSWQMIYEVINCCNVVICSVDESIGSEKAKDYLKAQALGLRVFYYYLLVNLYSDPYNSGEPSKMRGVPIIKQFSVDAKYPKPNSVEEVYQFMIADLMEALILIEKGKPEYEVSPNRVSKAMLHNLAARIYMQMNRWEDVITHSREALKLKNSLLKLEKFVTGMNLTTYGIYYRPYRWKNYANDGVEYTPDDYIWGYAKDGSWKEFFNDQPIAGANYTNRSFGVSKELKDLYDVNIQSGTTAGTLKGFNGDVRFLAYYNRGLSGASEFMTYGIKNGGGASGNYAESTSFGMRTSEVYLNLAEALIRTNKSEEAFELLNKLRESRWRGPYKKVNSASFEEDLKFCLEERRRELSFEHIRWFDLRRLGRPRLVHKVLCYPGQESEVVLNDGDPRYTLPIPKAVTDRNPELL